MFHWATGIPFQNEMHAGAYDDLTFWEQIDDGEQYTPAKKFLICTPIVLYAVCLYRLVSTKASARFLLSTHYTDYNPSVFAINFTALMFSLFPKLPIVCANTPRAPMANCLLQLHGRRVRVLPGDASGFATPAGPGSGAITPRQMSFRK